jgi:histidine triad (HIT) family protein
MAGACVFCAINREPDQAAQVFADEHTLAFLDHRPLFPGHVLVVPREHHETLPDLPPHLLEPLFGAAQLLSRAVESALAADGTFLAINNKVSQSVPHLHVHVIPRRRKDGLKGFFWPRVGYTDAEAMRETQRRISAEAARLRAPSAD